jgi:Crinkler effector protein N-terminal domain
LSDLSINGKDPTVRILVVKIAQLFVSDDELRLVCWVLTKSNEPFSVKIGKREIVDELKKAVRKADEPNLDYCSASALNIWKVSLSSIC